MTKTKIITDTNIWYNISQEEILEISKDFQLVVPIILLREIYTSPNVLEQKTFENMKKGIKTILENLEFIEFIEYLPLYFLLKNSGLDIQEKINIDFYIQEFKAFTNINYELIQLNYKQVEDHIKKRGDVSGLTNHINNTALKYRKIINKNRESKIRFKKFNTIESSEALLLKWANANLKEENTEYPKIEKITQENELLLKTFNSFLREISKVKGKKVEDNDWVDILNLSYVGSDDLYWTHEKKIKKLIIESRLENYLFKNKIEKT